METELSDESFTVAQLKAGDNQAWEQAFLSFYNLALNVLLCCHYPLSEQELEDVAQNAVLGLIDKYVEKAESIAELKKLLLTIAKNKAKDLIRSRNATIHGGGKVESLEGQPEGTQFKLDAADPAEEADQVERALLLREALKKLPEKYAEVLEDCYFHNLSQQESATKRGLKLGSIGVYISRGLEKLKIILGDEGLL